MEPQMKTQMEQQEKTEVRIPCETYSRIVGYLRPVDAWNEGKQQEYSERTEFDPNKGSPAAK